MVGPLRALVVLVTLSLAAAIFITPAPARAENEQGGTVTVEWLGWNAWRFTSPTGKVILANPFVNNPDSIMGVNDITRADLILVTNGHQDEVGQAIEIALSTGGRIVSPTWELGGWFIEMGVPAAQIARVEAGYRVRSDGITVRVTPGHHGSALPQPSATFFHGGPAAAFVVTFENGWTIYYGGSTAATQDQALAAQMYRPDAAILHMGSSHEPMDFAMQVKLLMTDNPNLTTVFPGHHRFVQQPGQTTLAETQAAVDAMGLGLRVSEPTPGQSYSFTK